MAESPDTLPSLDSLQQRIDEAKTHSAPEEQPDAPSQSGVGDAMRMGVELVAGVAVGSTIGCFLDRWLGTMPLFFVVCFFLGAAAGFRNMIRETRGK